MIIAVVVLCVLCLVNLIFTAGVMRRLREHTAVLDTLAGDPPAVMRAAGAAVDDFAATAIDGTPIGRDLLTGLTLVGFFSPTCEPCHERQPEFQGRARRSPGGRAQVLAVVVGARDDCDPMVATLTPHATVAVEPPGGPLAEAFGVRGFPAFGLVDGAGIIVASATDLRSIPIPVAG